MMSLFDASTPPSQSGAPLAERMRPRTLDEFTGQEHLLAPGRPLRAQIERDTLGSLIFWGPPGVGKTTLARIIAQRTQRVFVPFSAVTSGIKEIRQVMADAEKLQAHGRRTILFVDEIHRFNKAQQDAFLPYVEKGTITLIGATTENPSFEINSALLSRARVYVLRALEQEQIVGLLQRALQDRERGLLGNSELARERRPLGVEAEGEALQHIALFANGDARSAYNMLEAVAASAVPSGDPAVLRLTKELVSDTLQRKMLLYDKGGEEHFNLISALHKSLRNSDPQAALYWTVRMLQSGEDPMYVARRMVRFAVEDIGLADPRALEQALAARDAFHFLGLPEGGLALAQAAVYLAMAPKSNALYTAYGEAQGDVQQTQADPVPMHLRNAPTALMKELGYSRGYQYAHDVPGKVAAMQCLPDNLRDRRYYRPSGAGFERRLQELLEAVERKQRPEASAPSTTQQSQAGPSEA